MKLSRKRTADLDRLMRIRLRYVRAVLDRYLELRPDPKDPALRHLRGAADSLKAPCGHPNSIACGTDLIRSING